MKNLITTCTLLAIFSFTASASEFRFYATAKVVDKVLTNYDVFEYLETINLSDTQMVHLFERAGKDYDKYIELRNELLRPQYERGIRQWTYFQMVEKEAIKERRSGKSPAFRVTQEDYNKALRDIEDKAVRKYLDQRLGIVKARDLVGKDLIDSGFPHRKSETNTEIYFRWYELQKRRLMEAFRVREVRKHEYFQATRGHEVYIRPTDIWDFGKKNETLISEKLNNKRMDKSSLLKFMTENSDLRVTLESLDSLSLSDMSLASIYKLNEQEAINLAQKIKTTIKNEQEKIVGNITKYIGIAHQFSSKYSSVELTEKSKTSRENYLKSTGDYTDLVLSKIYDLAQEIQQGDATSELQTFIASIPSRLDLLTRDISNEEKFNDEKNAQYLAGDLMVRLFKQQVVNKSKLNRMAEDLASSIIKFEIIKLGLKEKSLVMAKSCSLRIYECQKKIDDHLKAKEIEKGIKRFRDQDLSFYDGLIEINLDGKNPMRGGEAFDWVFEKN
ncbi:MAG: hypothetical protein Fur0010_07900 [Bdellovibrio sp.]